MTGLARLAWWLAAALIGWTYVGFPLTVLARARLRPRPIAADAAYEPTITIVIAAYDEGSVIGAKLENALGLDYPADRLDIVVASDGSTDDTERVVASFADRGVRLLRLPRSGKATALNAAVAEATGELLVFTDANSVFEVGALRALVGPFADPHVGGVAGDQRYVTGPVEEGAGERQYWDLDRRLKVAESEGGSVISATGAIYAIRRDLFRPIPPGVTDDFTTSTLVIEAGRRLVFAPDAIAYERVAPAGRDEFERKVRIMTRGLRAVGERRALLDSRRHGFYAVQLATHKVLRRLMFVPLLAIAVTSPLLWPAGWLYRLATLAQAAFYGIAAVGLVAGDRGVARRRSIAFPAFFVLANTAAARAVANVLRGRRIDQWQPTTRPEERR